MKEISVYERNSKKGSKEWQTQNIVKSETEETL